MSSCGWGENMEKNLLTKKENSAIRSILHEKQCRKNKKIERTLMLVNIILLFISAILLIVGLIVPDISVDYSRTTTILILTAAFISVIISVIFIVGDYGALSEQHHIASIRYKFLEHYISNVLCINPNFIKNPRGYFLWVGKQYDEIMLSSPPIHFTTEFVRAKSTERGDQGNVGAAVVDEASDVHQRRSSAALSDISDVFKNVDRNTGNLGANGRGGNISINPLQTQFNRRELYSNTGLPAVISDREKKDHTYEMDKFILDSYQD